MKVVIVGGVTLLDVLREHLDEIDRGKVYGEFTVMYDPFNLSKII